jgi:exodeoxyribonuclease V alpha subunit
MPRPSHVAGGTPFDGELVVRRLLFTAPDASFAVLAAEDEGGWVHVVGPLAHVASGQRVRVVGRWENSERYGLQVRAEAAYELDPRDAEGALAYLLTIPHIGKRRARWLIERHGAGLFDEIDADPEAAFAALPGVGAQAAARAGESWRGRRALRELYVLLAPHGAGWLADRLHRRHGAHALEIVRSEPYRLTEEHGIGFQRADAIARAQGVPEDSRARARAAVVHVLQESEARGNTHLPVGELAASSARLVGELPEDVVGDLEEDGIVIADHGRIGLRATWSGEVELADRLATLAAADSELEAPPLAAVLGELSEEQAAAVRAAFEHRLSVVTGGPGTGKTTMVRAIVAAARRARLKLALCAPTGRAARRLEEATGHRASTIHRLVEWAPGEGALRGPEHPLECDLLVADESSMLSLPVARMLVGAIGERTHLVLIGDADQLPPVGAGKPFADLIASGAVPVTRLTHVFRQAARSLIVRAAHAINEGRRPATDADGDQVRDFFLLERGRDDDAAELIVELATQRLPGHYGIDAIRELQVVAPIYRGAVGVDALNERLRAALNPEGERCLDGDLRAGDKLIQTRNDYETGLMNGQILIALGETDDGERLVVETDEGREVTVGADAVRFLRPAYAISVHKAQGCEVPVVVVPLHRSHSVLLSRNLLYTAVTRARKACVLVGQPEALDLAVRRADSSRRHTRLAGLLDG